MNTAQLAVTLSETTPSRPGKRPKPVWIVNGADLAAYADALYAIGGKKWRGAFSFFTDPTDAIAQLGEQDRQSFAERQESARERAADRSDRLSDRAAKHARVAENASAAAQRIIDGIPFGQPILVGHHSERHARRDQDRIHSNMRKSLDEASYAGHLEGRARFNERKAAGNYTVGFCQRRIKETTAALRRAARMLAQYQETGAWHTEVEARKAECEDQIGFWQTELEKLGGVTYSKATIVKGDAVKIRGQWRCVVRANAKTVSVETGYSWTDTCPYAEIQEHRHAAAMAAASEAPR